MDFPDGKGFVREDLLHPVEGSVMGTVFNSGKPLVLDTMNRHSGPTRLLKFGLKPSFRVVPCP
jgi:hypothetical protein